MFLGSVDLQELEEDLQEVEVVLTGVVSLFIHMSLINTYFFVIPQLLSRKQLGRKKNFTSQSLEFKTPIVAKRVCVCVYVRVLAKQVMTEHFPAEQGLMTD